MSDVIWAAIIAVVGGAISGSIAGWVGFKVAQVQTALTKQTISSHERVELAKVKAENERLRDQHHEVERQHRQGTYHRFLAVIDAIDRIGTGMPVPTDDEFTATLQEFNYLHGGIHLFGDDRVRDALGPLIDLLEKAGEGNVQYASSVERFRRGYIPHRHAVISAQYAIIEAMRADVTIFPDPALGRRGA
jgi:hypothetical protein